MSSHFRNNRLSRNGERRMAPRKQQGQQGTAHTAILRLTSDSESSMKMAESGLDFDILSSPSKAPSMWWDRIVGLRTLPVFLSVM